MCVRQEAEGRNRPTVDGLEAVDIGERCEHRTIDQRLATDHLPHVGEIPQVDAGELDPFVRPVSMVEGRIEGSEGDWRRIDRKPAAIDICRHRQCIDIRPGIVRMGPLAGRGRRFPYRHTLLLCQPQRPSVAIDDAERAFCSRERECTRNAEHADTHNRCR